MRKSVPEVECTLRVTAWVTTNGIARIIGPRRRYQNGGQDPYVTKEAGATDLGVWELAGNYIPYFPETLQGGRDAVENWLRSLEGEGFTVTQLS